MLGTFACIRHHFLVEMLGPLRPNSFPAFTLRGGFVQTFKHLVSTWPPGDCPRCQFQNTCCYVFETAPPPGAEKLRGLDRCRARS